MISDLGAAKDELEVAEESQSEVENVATLEKVWNFLLMAELEQTKKRLVDYEAREEGWASEKKIGSESEEFFDLLSNRSTIMFNYDFEEATQQLAS